MGHIRISNDSKLEVELQRNSDVTQFRVALKFADGADEVVGYESGDFVPLDPENPFNFIALWATDFTWDQRALKVGFDCLAPIAKTSIHLNTRTQRNLLMRNIPTPKMPPGFGGTKP